MNRFVLDASVALSWFIDSYHAILYYGTWPPQTQFIAMILISVASLVGGYVVFLRMRARLPEEVRRKIFYENARELYRLPDAAR